MSRSREKRFAILNLLIRNLLIFLMILSCEAEKEDKQAQTSAVPTDRTQADVTKEVIKEEAAIPPKEEDKFEVNPSDEEVVFLAYISCLDLKNKVANAPSGVYPLYYKNEQNQNVITKAYCDMENEGGGWTMILNYVHQANTNPPLTIRNDTFPMFNSNTLGDDEQNTEFWGHLSPAFLSKFQFQELRFYCQTNEHTRIVHFATNFADCINYAKTGAGSCNGVEQNFTALTDHTGLLPAQNIKGDSEKLVRALTETTLRDTNGAIHWSIGSSIDANDWECDNDPDNEMFNTIHRIWIR